MTIKIVHDGTKAPEPAENCCFCWTLTRCWHNPSDVAVCPDCALVRNVKEIPLKRDWCKDPRHPKYYGRLYYD